MFSRLLSLIWVTALCALLPGCDRERLAVPAPKTVEDRFLVKVGGHAVRLQVAIFSAESQKGLMYRQTLEPDEGMIFLHEQPQKMSFWMRNVELPLDIGFFDSDGRLQEVYPMYPHDERPTQSLGIGRFALEMNLGWYRKHGLKPGDTIDLNALSAAVRARGLKPERFGLR